MMLLVASMVSTGYAEEINGVQVYPGAKLNAQSTKLLKEQMGMNGTCYATSDPLVKVVEFYKKQSGAVLVSSDRENALLQKGTVNITVQNPWMDMQSGKLSKNTLISIVNN